MNPAQNLESIDLYDVLCKEASRTKHGITVDKRLITVLSVWYEDSTAVQIASVQENELK